MNCTIYHLPPPPPKKVANSRYIFHPQLSSLSTQREEVRIGDFLGIPLHSRVIAQDNLISPGAARL